MDRFSFRGPISASKSILNRVLTIQSYEAGIEMTGTSLCDDVRLMQTAFKNFKSGERSFDCGHAGTVFRFLALRLSREPGEWMLLASPRLLSRPHAGLYQILDQLGVAYHLTPAGLAIQSRGWQPVEELIVDGHESSQFLSSLVLNSWKLPWELKISLKDKLVSRGYFELTKKLVQYFGMSLKQDADGTWMIPAEQKPTALPFAVEPDMSSCFAIAACAIFGGSCIIEDFPRESRQPDLAFRDFLKMMNVVWHQENGTLQVRKSSELKPLRVDVNNTPDVVPVLAVLLARAEGVSRLTGFEHLVHKESNRLQQVQDLLKLLGRHSEVKGHEFLIYGDEKPFTAEGVFNPDEDHRMAMAAQVANFGGANLDITHKEVVAKSFPEFWQIVEAP
jgi:3-phosphoshikimate 1-carboxyvinyltransferase